MENPISFDNIFMDAATADVNFVLKSRENQYKTVPAHRLIITCRSIVFDRMFNGALKETGAVHITDFSSEEFIEYLQFFYKNRVELTPENISGVLGLIDKYATPEFYTICTEFMKQTATFDRAEHYFELCQAYELPLRLETLLRHNWRLIFLSDFPQERKMSDLLTVLRGEDLSEPEFDIFMVSMNEIVSLLPQTNEPLTEKTIEQAFGDIISNIRFPVMTDDQLTQCFAKYPSLLPSEEISDLQAYVSTKRPLTTAKRFSCEKRQGQVKFSVLLVKLPRTVRSNDIKQTLRLIVPAKHHRSSWIVDIMVDDFCRDRCTIKSYVNGRVSKDYASVPTYGETYYVYRLDIGSGGSEFVMECYLKENVDREDRYQLPTTYRLPEDVEAFVDEDNFLFRRVNFRILSSK